MGGFSLGSFSAAENRPLRWILGKTEIKTNQKLYNCYCLCGHNSDKEIRRLGKINNQGKINNHPKMTKGSTRATVFLMDATPSYSIFNLYYSTVWTKYLISHNTVGI